MFNGTLLCNFMFIVGRFRSCKWFSIFLKKDQLLVIHYDRLFWLRERKHKLILQTVVLGFTHLSVTFHSQLCCQLGHTLPGFSTCNTAHLTTFWDCWTYLLVQRLGVCHERSVLCVTLTHSIHFYINFLALLITIQHKTLFKHTQRALFILTYSP